MVRVVKNKENLNINKLIGPDTNIIHNYFFLIKQKRANFIVLIQNGA